MIFIVLFVAYLISWLVVLFSFIMSKKIVSAPLQCFTGSLGQGKTKIGVSQALKRLKRQRFKYALNLLDSKEIPVLYSNIPIVIKNSIIMKLFLLIFKGEKLPNYERNVQLKFEHLIMTEEVKEYSVVFIDEVSDIASQYQFDNPLVVQYIQTFVRYFRHFIDGYLIMTDQVTDNVTKPIRTRIGKVYNLSNFRRFLFHWYKVDVIDVFLTEDIQTIESEQLDSPPFFFGYLPYKYLKKIDWTRLFNYKQYETRAFKPLYEFSNLLEKDLDINGGLFTKYVISLPDNSDMKKKFRQQGFITRSDMLDYINKWQLALGIIKDKKQNESA